MDKGSQQRAACDAEFAEFIDLNISKRQFTLVASIKTYSMQLLAEFHKYHSFDFSFRSVYLSDWSELELYLLGAVIAVTLILLMIKIC